MIEGEKKMNTQTVSISIHHPTLYEVKRGNIEDIEPYLVLVLASGQFANGTVRVYIDDDEWNAIVEQVRKFRVVEGLERAKANMAPELKE